MTKAKPVCRCDLCGEELYVGDVRYRLSGLCVCPDCLLPYARDFFRSALEVVE